MGDEISKQEGVSARGSVYIDTEAEVVLLSFFDLSFSGFSNLHTFIPTLTLCDLLRRWLRYSAELRILALGQKSHFMGESY